jgi:hypothetical protein
MSGASISEAATRPGPQVTAAARAPAASVGGGGFHAGTAADAARRYGL